MRIRISLQDGAPIYLQIVRQVKFLAASGRLSPGDKLPPVRKLAQDLMINPNTVARAYRELENAGLLTTRPGAGVFISELGSPLAKKEKIRILNERIDLLLAEADLLGIGIDEMVDLVKKGQRKMNR